MKPWTTGGLLFPELALTHGIPSRIPPGIHGCLSPVPNTASLPPHLALTEQVWKKILCSCENFTENSNIFYLMMTRAKIYQHPCILPLWTSKLPPCVRDSVETIQGHMSLPFKPHYVKSSFRSTTPYLFSFFFWLCYSLVADMHAGAQLWHAESTSLNRNQTWAPCIGSTES